MGKGWGDGSWEMEVADARSGGFLRIERTKQGDGRWEIGENSGEDVNQRAKIDISLIIYNL
jgi:hypothetical protein